MVYNKLTLETPVKNLFMVGPTYAKRLKKLKVKTARDLLYHFPFRYKDYSKIVPINQARGGESATISGTVWKIQNEFTKVKSKRITTGLVNDGTGEIHTVWFNQPFLTQAIKVGCQINLSGKVEGWGRKLRMISPEWEITRRNAENYSEKRGNIHTGRLVPVYPETAGVSSKWLRSRIFPILEFLILQEKEWLPAPIRESERLIDLDSALRQIHFPKNARSAKMARERLAFEELFLLQLGAFERRKEWKKQKVSQRLEIGNCPPALLRNAKRAGKLEIGNFIRSLPFELTNAQKRSVKDILEDLGKDSPMNRLLEGDVGSGKTVVAAIAMYVAFLNGCQSVLMAPTEILANQHFQTLNQFLSSFGVKVALQTGAHKDLKGRRAEGGGRRIKFDVVVGTHALLSDAAQFKKLALVVIDEQHRFGVTQRAKLKHKGNIPHLLTMTATPIPRTVALTFYGDLDLSLIDEMPKGRQRVQTWVVKPEKRKAAYEWIEKQILNSEIKDRGLKIKDFGTAKKSQAFIICPLIEESDKETMKGVKAATAEYKKLQEIFPYLKLGLLHGRMKAKEKNQVLIKFKKGALDLLVATPVVEVGIDVPNAIIMVIEGAERFGLAQLHQLRGRVGRGRKKSYCLLFSTSRSTKAYQRLKTMEKLYIGHKLAEVDLKLRGPGQIFGTTQHGFLELKVASLSDLDIIQKARKATREIFNHDPELKKHPLLKQKLKEFTISQVEPD